MPIIKVSQYFWCIEAINYYLLSDGSLIALEQIWQWIPQMYKSDQLIKTETDTESDLYRRFGSMLTQMVCSFGLINLIDWTNLDTNNKLLITNKLPINRNTHYWCDPFIASIRAIRQTWCPICLVDDRKKNNWNPIRSRHPIGSITTKRTTI